MSFQHTRKGQNMLWKIRDIEKQIGMFPGKKIRIEEKPMQEYLAELQEKVNKLSNSEIRANQLQIEIERREGKRHGRFYQ